jgi:hypothetical protein
MSERIEQTPLSIHVRAEATTQPGSPADGSAAIILLGELLRDLDPD